MTMRRGSGVIILGSITRRYAVGCDALGVAAIVAEIMNHAAPEAIILMHDGGGERDQAPEALYG